MVQGVNKEYIFKSKKYIDLYMRLIDEKKKAYNFTILAYCIMNNHAHFLIHVPNILQLSEFMHNVNAEYASRYNQNENRVGVLFRNRYKTEPIYEERYLINCINYIHNNPVKAGMVNKCGEYKYSSYRFYCNNTGPANSEIMQQIFGKGCNYLDLFEKSYEKIFCDVDSDRDFCECFESRS